MTSAAFKATYSDWKPVKSRRVIQVVFEVPWEKHDEAYQALGGMCDPGKERWFGIARLTEGKEGDVTEKGATDRRQHISDTPPRLDSNASAGAERGHKSPAQVAGYLCTLGSFQGFLEDHHPTEWSLAINKVRDPGRLVPYSEVAAECVRILCKVKSRTYLTDRNTEWNSLLLAFRAVEKAAEVVPA